MLAVLMIYSKAAPQLEHMAKLGMENLAFSRVSELENYFSSFFFVSYTRQISFDDLYI